MESQTIDLLQYLPQSAIHFPLKSKSKSAIFKEMSDILCKAHDLTLSEEFSQAFRQREEIESTAIGKGIAILHCKSEKTNSVFASFGISSEGILFRSPDGELVRYIFALVVPESKHELHLRILAKISKTLSDSKNLEVLQSAKSPEQILSIFSAV